MELDLLKKQDEQLTSEYHDLLMQIKDVDLFLKLSKNISNISNNSFKRGIEVAKEIYK